MAKSRDAFRTISEVADWLETPAHVLRFWESRFSQIKPVKRAGGRRYYRPNDMLLLGGIKRLLHHDGITIKGVQKILREKGIKHVADMSGPLTAAPEPAKAPEVIVPEQRETEVNVGLRIVAAPSPELPPQVLRSHPDRPQAPEPAPPVDDESRIAALYQQLLNLRNRMDAAGQSG